MTGFIPDNVTCDGKPEDAASEVNVSVCKPKYFTSAAMGTSKDDNIRLPCGVVNRLLAEVSQDLMVAQGTTGNVRTSASNVLVALARTHFTLVMAELQGHLKATGEMSKEFADIIILALCCHADT